MAFLWEGSIHDLILAALDYVPADCKYRKLVTDVVGWCDSGADAATVMGRIMRYYGHSDCTNMYQNMGISLLALLLGVISAGDAYFALHQTAANRSLFLVVAIIVASILLTLMAYGFALQAMFDNPLKLQLLNTLKLALVAPGKTIKLWVILLIPVIVFLVLPPVALRMIGFLYIVLGVSAPVYACSHILMDLFEQVEQAASKQD
jgi:TM2 domain-containing membrane protein YozV